MKIQAITAVALLVLVASAAGAAENMAGVNAQTVPTAVGATPSDALFTVPFTANYEYMAAVDTVDQGNAKVTVNPTDIPGSYADTYYVRFTSGAAEGRWSTVQSNTAGEIVVKNADILAGVVAGDEFRVYKHHTISSVLPLTLLGLSYLDGTQILLFENSTATSAQNRQVTDSATFYAAYGNIWFGTVSGSKVLPPQTKFVLRNYSTTQALQFIAFGNVADYDIQVQLAAPTGVNDFNIGTGFNQAILLKDAGLDGDGRTVLFYDNAAQGTDKQAVDSATFYAAYGNIWFGTTDGNEPILPGQTITLRLPAGDSGWARIPNPLP